MKNLEKEVFIIYFFICLLVSFVFSQFASLSFLQINSRVSNKQVTIINATFDCTEDREFEINSLEKAMISGTFKINPYSIFLGLAFNSTKLNQYSVQAAKPEDIMIDYPLGLMGSNINKNIGSFGLTEFSKSIGGFMTNTMKIGVNSSKTTISIEVKKDLQKKTNKK